MWSNSLELFMLVGLSYDIVTQPLLQILRVRHGRYAGGIDRLHLRDQIEDTVNLLLPDRRLCIADGNASKTGNPLHIVQG